MKIVKLGDYAKIKTGKLDANASSKDGKYPFFTCSNESLKIDKYSYDCECVLVAGNGDLNVKYYKGKFDAYQRTYIIEIENKEIINTKYMYYLISSNIEKLRREAIGGVIKYIKLENLTNIEFKLIDIKKQEKIVQQLDKLQEIIELRKKQIEELEKLKRAQYIDMFGDPILNNKKFQIKKLSEIAEYYIGLTYKPINISEEGILVLRSGNIQNSELVFTNNVRVNIPIKEKLFVKENDILMCSRNGSARLVGKVAKIPKLKEKMTFGAFMTIIRSKYYDYLFTYFQLEGFRKQLIAGQTTTINQITTKMLNNIKLPVPPLELQNQFSNIVKKIDKQKEDAKKSLKQMQEMQKSLMNQYFK